MNKDELQFITKRDYPKQIREEIASTLILGYLTADKISNDNTFLSSFIGQQAKPYIRRAAIDGFLEDFCKRNKFNYYTVGTHFNSKHIEFEIGSTRNSAHRIQKAGGLPKNVKKKDLLNQISLPFDKEEIIALSNKPHCRIVHAGKGLTPDYIAIGFIDKWGSTWLHIETLEIKPIASDAPVEEVEEEIRVKLKKQNIQKSSK